MAVTISQIGAIPVNGRVEGNLRRTLAVLTLDSSYPTGGYALSPALFGLTRLDAVLVDSSQGGRIVSFNQSTGKLQCWSAVNTEYANTTDLHTETVIVEAIGV